MEQEDGDEWQELDENGDTTRSSFRRFMMEQVRKRAAQGDRISAQLLNLESMARDFYLGADEDEDESDIEDLGI